MNLARRLSMPLAAAALAATPIACEDDGDHPAVDASSSDSGTPGGSDGGGPDGAAGIDAPPADGDMTFFVTSAGNGAAAGDYGGLAGADQRCQQLAAAAGAGDRTWRAYLSTDDIAVGEVIDARDRIGTGPWHNSAGVLVAGSVDSLHEDGIDSPLMLDERRQTVPRTEHDLLTGSGSDGRVRRTDSGLIATCRNWTTSANGEWAWVGHTDDGPGAWNDASHDTRCSQSGMMGVNGAGRLMCFAID